MNDFLQIKDLTIVFDTFGGLQRIRALKFRSLLEMKDEDIHKLYHPNLSHKLREYGLEALVVGIMGKEAKALVHDVIDLTTISRQISSYQNLSDLTRQRIIHKLGLWTPRNPESGRFHVKLLDMFIKKEILITIETKQDLLTLLATDKEDYLSLFKQVIKNLHTFESVMYYNLDNCENNKNTWFFKEFLRVVVFVISKASNYDRVRRSLRAIERFRDNSLKYRFSEKEMEYFEKLIQLVMGIGSKRILVKNEAFSETPT